MKLLLVRNVLTPGATRGVLFIPKLAQVFTLEDPKRETKVKGITCIPAGIYKLALRTQGGMTKRYAGRFPKTHRGMIWLQDVPNFKYVYIHIGNYPEDTEGCVLVGNLPGKDAVHQSRIAYETIYPTIADAIESEEGCTIEIVEV